MNVLGKLTVCAILWSLSVLPAQADFRYAPLQTEIRFTADTETEVILREKGYGEKRCRTKNGSGSFTIVFNEPEERVYTLTQSGKDDPDIRYDASVYTVYVCAYADTEGNLKPEIRIFRDNTQEKQDGIVFRNTPVMKPDTSDPKDLRMHAAGLVLSFGLYLVLRRKRKEAGCG